MLEYIFVSKNEINKCYLLTQNIVFVYLLIIQIIVLVSETYLRCNYNNTMFDDWLFTLYLRLLCNLNPIWKFVETYNLRKPNILRFELHMSASLFWNGQSYFSINFYLLMVNIPYSLYRYMLWIHIHLCMYEYGKPPFLGKLISCCPFPFVK